MHQYARAALIDRSLVKERSICRAAAEDRLLRPGCKVRQSSGGGLPGTRHATVRTHPFTPHIPHRWYESSRRSLRPPWPGVCTSVLDDATHAHLIIINSISEACPCPHSPPQYMGPPPPNMVRGRRSRCLSLSCGTHIACVLHALEHRLYSDCHKC